MRLEGGIGDKVADFGKKGTSDHIFFPKDLVRKTFKNPYFFQKDLVRKTFKKSGFLKVFLTKSF